VAGRGFDMDVQDTNGSAHTLGADAPVIDREVPAYEVRTYQADGGQAADGSSTPAESSVIVTPKFSYGFLNINSMPWALVEIDGKKLAHETPLFDVKVRTGNHRLRFFNPTLNIEKIVKVRVRANQTQTVSIY